MKIARIPAIRRKLHIFIAELRIGDPKTAIGVHGADWPTRFSYPIFTRHPPPATHHPERTTDLSRVAGIADETRRALVLVLRLDTIVADWPRSADPPGRMPGDGVRPAEGMRWKRLGIRKVRKETPMRRIRGSVTVCCWLVVVGLAPMSAQAQSKGLPAPSALLAFRPTLPGVDYDMPADQKAIDACKVELVTVQNRSIGYALRDGQGKMLRRFVANRGGKMDQWSYYQDGFEVYREIDLDGDQALDEARWMNAGGMRVATVKKGKIVGWKQISAEEASKVFVQGLVQAMNGGDTSLLEAVMATPDELSAAGLPREVVDKVAANAAARGQQVGALLKSLTGWTRQTVWNRFDGTYPHVIPADPAGGLDKDVVVYENAMIFPGMANGQADAAAAPPRIAFLQIPDMIKLGETWKFIELPRAIDPEKPVVSQFSGLRAMIYDRLNNVQPRDEAVDTALKALADYDGKNAALMQGGPRDRRGTTSGGSSTSATSSKSRSCPRTS